MSDRLSRRVFLRRGALGVGAVALLAACGPVAPSQPAPTTAPPATAVPAAAATPSGTVAAAAPTSATRSGGGGPLSLLWWQAPTILNAHLSLATKDVGAVRMYSEPLADFNARNELVPILAAEIPSVGNGGVARDGSSVTWKLKRGVKWHDGQPFTAADVAFTFRYLREPATSVVPRCSSVRSQM